jgi:hypothetical protein
MSFKYTQVDFTEPESVHGNDAQAEVEPEVGST